MSLIVDKIKCVEESDEVGSDDIYLLIFRGNTAKPFESNLNVIGPGNAWSDFDTGDTHYTDVGLAMTQSTAVYAVMLVEKDSGRDLNKGAVLDLFRAQTSLAWKAAMLAHLPGPNLPGSEAAKQDGYAAVRKTLNGLTSVYMEFPKGDDDVIDIKRVTITKPGQVQTLRFRSNAEDATYDVTFRQI